MHCPVLALPGGARHIDYEHSYQEGCSLGSLAGEIIKTDLEVCTELVNAFDQWSARR